MTKNFLPFILALLISTAIAFAPPQPLPVWGSVILNGVSAQGIDVEIRNLQTDAILKLQTDESGAYSFDANELVDRQSQGSFPGQEVEIKVCDNLDICKKRVRLISDPLRFDIVVGQDLVKEIEIIKERIVEVEKVKESVVEVPVGNDRYDEYIAQINELNNKLSSLSSQLESAKSKMREMQISVDGGIKTNSYALYAMGGLVFIAGLSAIWYLWKKKGKIAQATKAKASVLKKASSDSYKHKG